MNQNSQGFLNSIPVVTRNLIIINGLIWLAQFLLLKNGIDFSEYLGLHYFASNDFKPHQIITYMFLHDPMSPAHVFFNMFAVFMFGRTLETVWGGKRFLTYYMLTGIGAGLAQMLVTYIRIHYLEIGLPAEAIADVYQNGTALLNSMKNYADPNLAEMNILINTSTVGASGAVFGILLAFGMLFPNVELFIIPFPFPIKAKWFVIGYGLIELGLGIANRSGDNVAHFAHLGGLVVGLIIILYWKKKAKSDGRYY